MYYLANEVVSVFSLEGTVLLAFTGMLFVVYGVWCRLRTPPGRVWRQAVWIPALMAFYFSYSGWNDFTGLMSMLQQTEALTSEQHRVLFDHSLQHSLRTICFGLAGSAFLWWFIRRRIRAEPRITQQVTKQQELTSARKEENAEPV